MRASQMRTFDGIRLMARRELVERTRRDRSFLISTLVTLAILLAIIFVPKLLGANDPTEFDVGLVGTASKPIGQALTAQAEAAGIRINLQQPASAADAEAAVRDGKLDLAVVDGRELVAKAEPDEQLSLLVQAASRAARAQQTLQSAGVDQAEIQAALAPPPLPVRSLEPVDEDARSKRTIATVAVFLLYGQLIGYCFAVAMGVVEEKSTRVVEVLLAALRPVQLLAGKIIGVGLVGLIQLAIIGAIGLAVAVASNTITLPPDATGTIGSVLLWFLLGYAFYSSMFAVAGAIVSRQEELQNTATPLNLLMIASFFIAFSSSVSGADNTLAKVSSFLPPVAPLVMPLRIASGNAAPWESPSPWPSCWSRSWPLSCWPPASTRAPSSAPAPGSSSATPGAAAAASRRPAAPEPSPVSATRSLRVVEEAGVVGQKGDLDPVVEVELGQDARDVGLDRGDAEVEDGPDLGVGAALADGHGDLPLAVVEQGQAFPGAGAAVVARAGDPVDQAPGDRIPARPDSATSCRTSARVGWGSSPTGARRTPMTSRRSWSAWWAFSLITLAARATSSAGGAGAELERAGVDAQQRKAVAEDVVHLPGDLVAGALLGLLGPQLGLGLGPVGPVA
jgi:ABC-2 type transport system permease protein